MTATEPVAGAVLRAGREEVDGRLRVCGEHWLTADLEGMVVDAMRAAIGPEHQGLLFNGPRFVSYRPGHYFRAHQDRSEDAADPPEVRLRRLTLVCLLNDADPADGLPTFDGGALVVYGPGPVNVKPSAGSVVAFDSDLLHEVRPVRSGQRFSSIAWLLAKETA